MRQVRALWRLLRVLLHIGAGIWSIKTRFAQCTQSQRELLVQRWARQLLVLAGVTLSATGEPGAGGPVLLVANHISWLDIVVMHASRYCRFVAKADVRHWPLIGTLATGAGSLYIERASRHDAMRVVHRMSERLAAGEVIAVFPEGTTGDGVSLLPFHANLLQAAISSGAPVQPLALRYVDAHSGKTSFAPSFVGDDTLAGSIWRTLLADGLVAHVRVGSLQQSNGRNRRAWARDLQATVQALHGDTAPPS